MQPREAFGVDARALRRALSLLGEGWLSFDALVREVAAPRRSVEDLLAALGADVERDGDAVRLRPGTVAPEVEAAREPDAEASARVEKYVAEVPPPLPALDHVQATPETLLRRARWLDEQYDLARTRLVFVGDHDLTSLAVRELRPDVELTVVDVDDRVLGYLDEVSGRTIRTVFADLRHPLPLAVAGSADVVFSDPPYTPEGMALFAARGLDCLADPPNGRLVLAYGYSRRHPTLGQQVQRALLALGVTFEAILPAFNRYEGAQAIGSAADLYVCQPTAKPRAKSRKDRSRQGIYTHGPRSVETTETPARLREALVALAGEDGRAVEERGADWTAPVSVPDGSALAVDLGGDPGGWLVRMLLAVNAERVALLVPNAHPSLADARAQAELHRLVEPKYRLRLLRSTPDNKHAVVVAEAVDATRRDTAAHAVWTRAHGRLGNVWPDAPDDVADLRLIDLPLHRLAEARETLGAAQPS